MDIIFQKNQKTYRPAEMKQCTFALTILHEFSGSSPHFDSLK